jgi:hypothetical protein
MRHPITRKLAVTQDGCDSVTYVSRRTDLPESEPIRDKKDVDGKCYGYKEHPENPKQSCFLWRWDGEALLGETFDRYDDQMPWVRATTLRVTKTPEGYLREEFFERANTGGAPTASWTYTRE